MKDEKNKVTGLSLGALLFIIVLGFVALIGLTQASGSQNLNLDSNATNNTYYHYYFNDTGSLLYYSGQEVDVNIPTAYTIADRLETRKLEFINFYDINTFTQQAGITDYKITDLSEEITYPWGGSYYEQKWEVQFSIKPAIEGTDIATNSIGVNAFYNNQNIANVTLPETVISISDYAFANSTLNNISLSSNLQSIGSQAFQQTRLTSFEMPNSVTYAGFGLFQHCFELTNVVLSQNLTEIPSSMFWFCENLQSITIPNSVNYIGSQAFYYCYNLTSITIPESVQAIGNNAFMECYGLQYIVLERLTPPNINGSIINTAIIVYVPYNSLTQYQNSSWSMYDLRPVSELNI
ncbi:MAG: leucine-rich repeat domain-containing protein [Clostridia bacterium]|nr:leucine-rich repeat domain-containing protein [Clostridia bacterium]